MCMCVLGTIYLFNAHFLYTEPTSAEIQVGTSLDLKALHMEVHHCTKQVETLSKEFTEVKKEIEAVRKEVDTTCTLTEITTKLLSNN